MLNSIILGIRPQSQFSLWDPDPSVYELICRIWVQTLVFTENVKFILLPFSFIEHFPEGVLQFLKKENITICWGLQIVRFRRIRIPVSNPLEPDPGPNYFNSY